MNIPKTTALCGALVLTASLALAQEAPTSIAEVWDIVQRQQAEIDALRAELNEARDGLVATDEKVAESEARIEATGDVV